jgi:hypothetical protein
MLLNNKAAAVASNNISATAADHQPFNQQSTTMLINLAATADHLYIHNHLNSSGRLTKKIKGAKSGSIS